MKKHFLDKFILRELFWFIVIPYRLREFIKTQEPLPDDMNKILHDNLHNLYEE